jgi:hypothetical protein
MLMVRWGSYVLPGCCTPIDHKRQETVARAILYPPSLNVLAVPSRRPRKRPYGRTI